VRLIRAQDGAFNAQYGSNRVVNTKYTVWNFVPKNLWEQVRQPYSSHANPNKLFFFFSPFPLSLTCICICICIRIATDLELRASSSVAS
jgi:hypothetical protein